MKNSNRSVQYEVNYDYCKLGSFFLFDWVLILRSNSLLNKETKVKTIEKLNTADVAYRTECVALDTGCGSKTKWLNLRNKLNALKEQLRRENPILYDWIYN